MMLGLLALRNDETQAEVQKGRAEQFADQEGSFGNRQRFRAEHKCTAILPFLAAIADFVRTLRRSAITSSATREVAGRQDAASEKLASNDINYPCTSGENNVSCTGISNK